MKILKTGIIALAALAFGACGDSSTIGSTLLEDQVEIIVDTTFTVSGKPVELAHIRPSTVTQLLGTVAIDGFGTVSSEAVAQLLPSTQLDTAFVPANVDSVFFNLRYAATDFLGDSLAPMGVTIYPLVKQLPDLMSSDFNPDGYYNPSAPLGTATYNAKYSNLMTGSTNTYSVSVPLPRQFGVDLLQHYIDNPQDFANGRNFAANVLPGVYIRNSYGSGRLTLVGRTTITMNLRNIKYNSTTEKNDTTDAEYEYLFVSPEVLSNNMISVNLDPAVTAMADGGQPMLVSPLGYETELKLPVPEIIEAYRAGSSKLTVLNSLSLSIPVDSLDIDADVSTPPYVLLVLAKDRDAFFAENKLPDYETSFYAEYSATSGNYGFTGLETYLQTLLDKEDLTEEDYTFRMVPVSISFEKDATQIYEIKYIVSDVIPYFQRPAAAVVHLDKAKISLTYSRQTSL